MQEVFFKKFSARFFLIVAIIIGGTIVASLGFKARMSRVILENHLAALSQIEMNTVRIWQIKGGLKRDLVLGDRGEEVVLIQKVLGIDKEVYPEGKTTGFFGPATKRAVLKFQNKNSLKETGTVSERTREEINKLYFNEACPKPSKVFPDFGGLAVSKMVAVPLDYSPDDLEDTFSLVKTRGIACLRHEAAEALREMFRAAGREEVLLALTSGFRRSEIQKILYEYWQKVEKEEALDYVAEPGHSEHQLGTSVDLSGKSISYKAVDLDFHKTREGRWLQKNAYKFGFAQSYPEGKEAVTGYKGEPWHFRFIGKEAALDFGSSGLVLNQYLEKKSLRPIVRNVEAGLDFTAKAVVSVWMTKDGKTKKLFSRNSGLKLPIASLSKLMTALVAVKHYSPSQEIAITDRVVGSPEEAGGLVKGDIFKVNDLMYPLLIESSNDAGAALVFGSRFGDFIGAMNKESAGLGLEDTEFFNASGLDLKEEDKTNISTADDLVKIADFILRRYPEIFKTTIIRDFDLYNNQGVFRKKLQNTNEILGDQNFPLRIIGGKTGETPKARGCLLLIHEAPNGDGYIINVILGSEKRFEEMRELVGATLDFYEW